MVLYYLTSRLQIKPKRTENKIVFNRISEIIREHKTVCFTVQVAIRRMRFTLSMFILKIPGEKTDLDLLSF